jgi:tetratricopeptide (TPR) repeat protein
LQEPDNLEIPEPIEAQAQIPAVRDVVDAQTNLDRVQAHSPTTSPSMADEDKEPEPTVPPSDETLALAQTYLREGALDAAVHLYDQLAHVTAYQEQIIRDLEQSVQSYPRHHALQRILGDVYMRSGELQKALRAYQQALSKL